MSIQTEIDRINANISAAYSAIADMGGTLPQEQVSNNLEEAVRSIPSGTNTSDATATASDILLGKTAYANGQKITGTIQSQAAQTITPGTSNKTIVSGKYLTGTQTIKGDADLKAENIKQGVSIFGVAGSLKTNTVDWLAPVELKVGTYNALAGIMPTIGATNILTVYGYQDGAYRQKTYDISSSSLASINTLVGAAISVFAKLSGTKQTEAVQDVIRSPQLTSGTSGECYIVTGPNPIIAIVE